MNAQCRWLVCVWCFVLGSFCCAADFSKPDKDGFIADWLIGGPYPSYVIKDKDSGFADDCLGDEARFRPWPGLKTSTVFKADKSRLIAGIGSTNEWGYIENKTIPVEWKTLHAAKPDCIYFDDDYFGPVKDHLVYYAVCWIDSPEKRKIKFRLGSDDDHKLYLNGKLVGSANSSQGARVGDFNYTATLSRGLNSLTLKIVERIGGTGFCVALTDLESQPLDDIKVFIDDPRRELKADSYDNGYMARFEFADKDIYDDGDQQFNLTFYAPDHAEYTLKFSGKSYPMKSGQSRRITPSLKAGDNLLRVEVFRKDACVAVFSRRVTLYSRAKLKEEIKRMRSQLDEIRQERSDAEAAKRDALRKLGDTRKRLADTYAKLEASYAEGREKAKSKATKFSAEPLGFAQSNRSRLCLNGSWDIGSQQGVYSSQVHLPNTMYNKYFRTWYNPVRKADEKNPYGEVISRDGWEDFKFNDLLCAPEVWFAHDFTLEAPEMSAFFVCENIVGKVKVYNNGEFCGDYAGHIGLVEIPLLNLQKGRNRLELFFQEPARALKCNVNRSHLTPYGIKGDIFVDISNPVRVADVWVKTSWRQAELKLQTEVQNLTANDVRFSLKQYAVSDGMIRLCLPEQKGKIKKQERLVLKSAERWADPELWSPAHPNLYDLVSDLYVNGRLVDRQRTRFGFREFWVHGTDFFLNGKRTFLQGDTGYVEYYLPKYCDVIFPLCNRDGINTLRIDGCNPIPYDVCDRMGMLTYSQMYPVWENGLSPKKFSTVEEWLEHPLHQLNLDSYRAWHRLLRNHPSVVIWSSDNEILTQAWDTLEHAEYNVRNDRIGAIYEKYTKSLDPDIIMTRDGDVGTLNSKGRWFENPPCDTANYHYPDFNTDQWVRNWQDVYEYRPALFGETLYCSYGAWDKWVGAIASQVKSKAARVRQITSVYREEDVPGVIFMGMGLDGFIELKPDGSGTPWGIPGSTPAELKAYTNSKRENPRLYPWREIPWPAQSGLGMRPVAYSISCGSYGHKALNWIEAGLPTHVRNAVNDAYRDNLRPQAPLTVGSDAECIIKTRPNIIVWSISATGERNGVVSDSDGKAWFQFDCPGKYTFTGDGKQKVIQLRSRAEYAANPGFNEVKQYLMED